MPDSLEGLTTGQVMSLQAQDEELYLLLSGQAPAELELAAMNGSLSDSALSEEARQKAAISEQVNELLASNPWAAGSENLTAQMALASIAPDVYEQQVKNNTPAQRSHQFTDGDKRVLLAHGFSVPAE